MFETQEFYLNFSKIPLILNDQESLWLVKVVIVFKSTCPYVRFSRFFLTCVIFWSDYVH